MRPALVVLGALVFLSACGSDGPPAPGGPSPVPSPQTRTFTGSARTSGEGSCTGDTHMFSAAEGSIAVTLVQTSPAEALTAEICAPNVADKPRDCTLARTRIDIGQTLTAERKLGNAQTLSLLPVTCGAGGPVGAAAIAYTVAITYRQ